MEQITVDIDGFEELYDANVDEFESLGGFDVCFELACKGELVIGGGAAPTYRICVV